jgi:hypothetical protein
MQEAGAEAAIKPVLPGFLDLPQWQAGRSFPECPGISGILWNHFKTRLFPLHPRAASNIRLERITEGLLP